jgi:hypothetical protein
MKTENTQTNHQDDEYDGNEGCFIVLFAGGFLLLVLSLILNVALLMKLYQ